MCILIILSLCNLLVGYFKAGLRIILLLVFTSLSGNAFAQTHCQSSEYVVLSGKFGKIDKNGDFLGDKVLSLCADKKDGMLKMDYRFGLIDKIEMKYSAPIDGRLNLTRQQIMPRAGLDVLYFSKGKITYAVTECSGMHCSAARFHLLVYNGKNIVAKFASEPDKIDGNNFKNIKPSNIVFEKTSDLDFDHY